MTLTPEAHTAVDHLNIERIDQAIATAHAQITWRSPADRLLIRAVIDELLDRRNKLTKQ